MLRVLIRKEQFAHRRQVQRCPSTNRADHLHARTFAVGALDVDNVVALAHAEIDRLFDELMQRAHRPQRGITDIEPPFDQVSQFQQAHPQAVASWLVAVHIAADHQVAQEAVRGGRVQACFGADVLERQRRFGSCQDIDQPKKPLNHLNRWNRRPRQRTCPHALSASMARAASALAKARQRPSKSNSKGPKRIL